MSTLSSTRICRQFSIKEIKEATNQFDSRQILGQGGEAKVYYAEIYIDSKKTPVAVKHLKENSKEFESEIHIVSKIQHPNLVSLLGYYDESGHKILVYEYMAKGCLSDYLKKNAKISLSWLQRLNICLGAARGLQHLHIETDENPKGIIHRDVKPGNILVGENWVGKFSDFGMFKLSNAGQDKSLMTTNLKGTSGYYAPEYIKNRRITRKIDVYAFGVVLFEVLCRKMPWDREDESYYADEDEDLGFWAQQNVDPQIQGEVSRDSLKVYTDIIGSSLHAHPGRRPTMDSVVMDLQKAVECQDSENLEKEVEPPTRRLPSSPRAGEAAIVYEHGADIEALMPKLRHSDYYTEPRIQELAAKERAEPGYCRHVKEFVVGRHGYGSIKFLGETDVRRLELESLIQFNHREVIVYMDESKKPPVGQGLNKPAEVTLLNIKCFDKKTGRHFTEGPRIEKYKEMLRKKAEDQGAEFVSYDPVKGEWRFRVNHFSGYRLEDEDDDEAANYL